MRKPKLFNLLSFRRHAIIVLALTSILLGLSFTSYAPVKTVKGLLVDTGLAVSSGPISIDSGRVVAMNGTSGLAKAVEVYDLNSASSVSFAAPNGVGSSTDAIISSDKIVAVGNITSILFPFTATISYCSLPHASPVQACGPWHLLAKGLPQFSTFLGYGAPTIHGDLVAWWTVNGLAYHHFSSNVTETVSFNSPLQPEGLSTNGEIITFTLSDNPNQGNNCGTLEYIDTTSGSDVPVNTGLFSCPLGMFPRTSISQYTIVFAENSTGHNRIRYFDYQRGQASAAGQGPLGNLTNAQAIYGDRIAFGVSETSINFDCDGDGLIQGNQQCLDYWNIRAPSYVATTLAAQAAPSITSGVTVAIYDKTIVFQGLTGNLQYVTVPMKGDVNQDGVVDGVDKTLVNNCVGKVLKGSVC